MSTIFPILFFFILSHFFLLNNIYIEITVCIYKKTKKKKRMKKENPKKKKNFDKLKPKCWHKSWLFKLFSTIFQFFSLSLCAFPVPVPFPFVFVFASSLHIFFCAVLVVATVVAVIIIIISFAVVFWSTFILAMPLPVACLHPYQSKCLRWLNDNDDTPITDWEIQQLYPFCIKRRLVACTLFACWLVVNGWLLDGFGWWLVCWWFGTWIINRLNNKSIIICLKYIFK